MGKVFLYLGGLGCTIGWILAIVVSWTAGGSPIAIIFAVIGGPFFMWVEAIWWGEWLPVLVFYPSFVVYLVNGFFTGNK